MLKWAVTGLLLSSIVYIAISKKRRLKLAMNIFDSPLGYFAIKFFGVGKSPHRLQPRSKMIFGHLEVLIIPCLSSNYSFLIVDHELKTAIVVDPSESTPILTLLQENQWSLVAILSTHKHWDHTLGNSDLIRQFPNLSVYGHHLDFPDSIMQNSFKGVPNYVKNDDVVKIGRCVFNIIHTPGHTLGSVMYLLDSSESLTLASADIRSNYSCPVLFTGDSLFLAGCGILFEGSPLDIYNMVSVLKTLDPQTYIMAAHEYTVANLEFTKYFIKTDSVELALKSARNCEFYKVPSIPGTLEEELLTNPYFLVGERKKSFWNNVIKKAKYAGIYDSMVQEMKSLLPKSISEEVFEEILIIGLIRRLKDQFSPKISEK